MSSCSVSIFVLIVLFTLPIKVVGGQTDDVSNIPDFREKVVMVSGRWTPYADADLPEQGASVAIARAAFEAVGIQLVVRFYPWKRAVSEARFNPDVAGYLPEYYSKETAEHFWVSDSMGWGLVRLIYPTQRQLHWNTLDDLIGKRLGVVDGYVNTKEIDEMIQSGKIVAVKAVDDATLIRMTAMGRVDAAVIDPYVFQYLMTKPDTYGAQGKVRLHPKLLAENALHLYFRPDSEGKRLCTLFNEGLRQVDIRMMQESYLEKRLRKPTWPGR